MTGIERLREVATRVEDGECVSPDGECRRRGGLTCRSCLADELYGIADKAEAERERESAALFDARVGEEIDLCELFGIEPGDDPLAALRRHVEGQDDTIENLRLELGNCGASAAWVREHGGIAYVKDAWNVRSNLDRQLERAQAKVERQQRHIEFVQGKLTERNERIAELERNLSKSVSSQLKADAALYDLRREVLDVCRAHGIEAGDDLLRAIDEAMSKRLMPGGMEWPRYEDGEPVKFGDVVSDGDETGRVYYVTFDTVNPVIIGFTDETPDQDPGTWLEVSVNDGERVKRPALDADGVPVKVGDTVYPKYPYEEPDRQVESAEVVYVRRIGRIDIQAKYATGMSFRQQVDAEQLTHTKPEPPKRCRDCAHWQKDPTADNMGVCWFLYHEYEGEDCYAARRTDIGACEEFMPRASALAEREKGD